MRIGVLARRPLDWLAARLGYVPEPFLLTHPALVQAQALMAASEVGLFDALADAPRSTDALAADLGTDPVATAALLDVLVALRYLQRSTRPDGPSTVRLTRKARRWLTADSPTPLVHSLAFRRDEWTWLAGLSDFVRSGQPLDFHATMDAAAWSRYQAAMGDLARLCLPECWRSLRRHLPRPDGTPRHALDLGGASGTYAAAFARARPDLHVTVADLPDAVALATVPDDLAGRLRFGAADLRTADLAALHPERPTYDLVFVSQVLHHLDAETCRCLASRIAAVLRPGGVLAVQDVLRTERPDPLPALAQLYFAFTSRSGAWTTGTVQSWQRDAGLAPLRPIAYRTVPGMGLLVARR
ncbi:MAG: class I SAM-dependent methyltransferase [Bacteroidota bacterium]